MPNLVAGPSGMSDPISNSFPDLLFHVHRDGTFLGYIARDESTLFVSPTEVLGRTMAEILPENLSREGELAIGRALDTNSEQTFAYSLLQDGALNEYEARILPGQRDDALVIVRKNPATR